MRPTRLLFICLMVLVAVDLGLASPPRLEASPPQTILYVYDGGNPARVFGFHVQQTTGALQALSGSPFATNGFNADCEGACGALAYSTQRKLLFTAGKTGISVQRVAASGALTLVAGSPFDGKEALDGASVAVVPRGSKTFVYASYFDKNEIVGFKVTGSGALTELASSPYPAGDGPQGIATAGKILMVANSNTPSLSAYTVGTDGTLTPAPGSPVSVASDEIYNATIRGGFAYVADALGTGVFAFSIAPSGALTPVSGSPFATGLQIADGRIVVRGTHLFALGAGDPDIQPMRRDPTTGALTALAPVSSGLRFDGGGALSPGSKVLAVANPQAVQTFRVNTSTNGLTPAASRPLPNVSGLAGLLFVNP